MEKSIKKFIAFLMVVVLSFSVVSYVGNTDFTAKAASSTAISINKAPTLKSSSVKATSVKLSWGKTSGATSYKIYRSTDKKNWKCIKTTESTSYTVKKLTTETKYYFKIRAYKNSTKSPYSNIVAVTPKLTQVKSFKVKFNSNEKVTVSWAKVSGATAYQVLYSTSSDFKSGNKKITVDSDKLKCTIKNLNKNKKYYVKVRAIRKANGKTYKGSFTEKIQLVMKSKIYYRYVTQTVYATDNVNIRKGPDTSYSSVGVLKKGKSIKKIAAGSNKWTKVSYNGGTYYISSSYLTTTKPVVTTTTEPTTTKPTTTKPKEEITTKKPDATVTKTSGGISLKPITSSTAKTIANNWSTCSVDPHYEGKSSDGKTTVVYAKTPAGWTGKDASGAFYTASGEKEVCEYCSKILGTGNNMCRGDCAVTFN